MVALAGIDAAAVLLYDADVGTFDGLGMGSLAPIESARLWMADDVAAAAPVSPFVVVSGVLD